VESLNKRSDGIPGTTRAPASHLHQEGRTEAQTPALMMADIGTVLRVHE
jgi:hypothetical protein